MSQKIVLTGGPGGGKTTAAGLFRREIGESVVIVPEAATLLFSGGFPRSDEKKALHAAQKAIFQVQRSLEETHEVLYPERTLLCDRGSIDGAAYWPEGKQAFFDGIGVSREEEFSRYSAVIFFETAAVGAINIEGGNPTRVESLEEAIQLDRTLQEIWSEHPNFYLIPHSRSFMDKLNRALDCLKKVTKKGS